MDYSLKDIKKALENGKGMYEDEEAYEARCETAKDGWLEYSCLYELLAFAHRELEKGR